MYTKQMMNTDLKQRQQMCVDLEYLMTQDMSIREEIIDDRLNSLNKNIAKHSDNLDEYESDIKNYTTYDIHAKLMEVK